MQAVDALIAAVLNTRERDLTDLVEFYPYDVEPGAGGFDPDLAVARYSAVGGVQWAGHSYTKQFTGRSEIARSMGPEFNNASITFSNVNRAMAAFVLSNNVEGMRMVVRTVSRSLAPSSHASLVLFTGRIQRPAQINKKVCTINAKQDAAFISHEVPWRKLQPQCPVEFKGVECLGGQTLAEKSAAYQAATKCDFSHEQCAAYGNTDKFQGFRVFTITGNYRYVHVETVTSRRLFGLLGSKTEQIAQWRDGQWSSEDQTPYGSAVPVALGRVQAEGIPVEFADVGGAVKARYVFSEGPIDSFGSLKNQSGVLSEPQTFEGMFHLGEYGGVGSQGDDVNWPNSDKLSRTAFVSTWFAGGNVLEGEVDPLPVLTAVLRGLVVPVPDGSGNYTLAAWTDNPVHLTRYILTHPSVFNLGAGMMDDAVNAVSAQYCDEVLIDDSNAERLIMPESLAPNIGTEPGQHRRFPSTGLINTARFRHAFGFTDDVPEFEPPDLEPFPDDEPPAAIAPRRYLRKRYTANALLRDPVKAVDFLFKVLLPSFRGYLTVGSNGKIAIRVERPVDNARLRDATAVGALALAVDDVMPWRSSTAQQLLIGTGLVTSEVRKVTGARFSFAGNAQTLAAAASGPVTATASGATLTGGNTSVQASGTITIGGAMQAGAQVSATIEGVQAAYTLTSLDTAETVAAMLASHINATPALKRVVVASYAGAVVTIKSRLGWLDLDAALANIHDAAEECLRIAGVFDKKNIVDGSFEWPLGQNETPVNQVVVTYREASADFAKRELRINDSPHQHRTGKIEKLEINAAAVDNFHQAQRLGEAEFSKRREGDFLCGWQSGPAALVYDEGDVVAVNDDSGGFVNVPVRVERLKISETRYVGFTARLYSTIMFSDEVGQHTITLASVLPLLSKLAPPPASNLELEEGGAYAADGTWMAKARGTFDFGEYIGQQVARVYVKGPADADFIEQPFLVTVGEDGAGTFDLPNLTAGPYSVRVVTESSFGTQADAGHPVEEITIDGRAPAPPAPTDLFAELSSNGAAVLFRCTLPDVPDFAHLRVYDADDVVIFDRIDTDTWSMPGATSITVKVSAVNRSGREGPKCAPYTFTAPAPPTPTGLHLSYKGDTLRFTWDAFEGATFQVSLDGSSVVWQGQTNVYDRKGQVAGGTVTQWVRQVRYSVPGPWAQVTVGLWPADTWVIGVAVTNGDTRRWTWDFQAGTPQSVKDRLFSWHLRSTSAAGNIDKILPASVTSYEATRGSGAFGSESSWSAVAVDASGNESANFIGALASAVAVAGPTVTKDAYLSTPTLLSLHVATTVDYGLIQFTRVQTRTPGGAWPSTAEGTDRQVSHYGAPREVYVLGQPGSTVEARVGHEDAGGSVVWSSTITHTFPQRPGVYYVEDFASFAAAVTALSTLGKQRLVVSSLQTLTASVDVPSNITLECVGAGGFTSASAYDLTIRGGFVSDPVQRFAGAVAVKFVQSDTTPNAALAEAYAEWWGAVGNDSTNDTAAFNACLAALKTSRGIALRLLARPYRASLTIPAPSNAAYPVSIVGSGDGSSIRTTSAASPAISLDLAPGDPNVSLNLRNFSVGGRGTMTAPVLSLKAQGGTGNRLFGVIDNVKVVGSGSVADAVVVRGGLAVDMNLRTEEGRYALYLDGCSNSIIRLHAGNATCNGVMVKGGGNNSVLRARIEDSATANTRTVGTISGTGSLVTVVTTTAHGMEDMDRVTLSGTSGFNFTTPRRVTVIDATTFTFAGTETGVSGGGTVRISSSVIRIKDSSQNEFRSVANEGKDGIDFCLWIQSTGDQSTGEPSSSFNTFFGGFYGEPNATARDGLATVLIEGPCMSNRGEAITIGKASGVKAGFFDVLLQSNASGVKPVACHFVGSIHRGSGNTGTMVYSSPTSAGHYFEFTDKVAQKVYTNGDRREAGGSGVISPLDRVLTNRDNNAVTTLSMFASYAGMRPITVVNNNASGFACRIDPNGTEKFLGAGAGKYLEIPVGGSVTFSCSTAGELELHASVGAITYEP